MSDERKSLLGDEPVGSAGLIVEKRDYIQWTGRDAGEIYGHVERYGLPLRDAAVDVPKLVRWLHDYFSGDVVQLALEGSLKDRKTAEEIAKLRIDNQNRQLNLEAKRGELLPIGDVTKVLWTVAEMFRELGERLGRDYGPDAQDNVFETLGEVERQIALLESEAKE